MLLLTKTTACTTSD